MKMKTSFPVLLTLKPNKEAVFGKLHPCQSLSKKVKLLEDSIYEEGAKIFGHSPSHHKNLSVTSRRTAHSISLINEKKYLAKTNCIYV